MDNYRQGEQSPTTKEEYRRALTRLTKRAQENGITVERFWCCRADDDTGNWEVEITPLAPENWRD